VVLVDVALVLSFGTLGVVGAWLIRRRSSLSIRNLYAVAVLGLLGFAVAAAARWWLGVMLLGPIAAPAVAGALVGRRWRLQDLGAGDELRRHELSRRWRVTQSEKDIARSSAPRRAVTDSRRESIPQRRLGSFSPGAESRIVAASMAWASTATAWLACWRPRPSLRLPSRPRGADAAQPPTP